jgi:hypothetical protein
MVDLFTSWRKVLILNMTNESSWKYNLSSGAISVRSPYLITDATALQSRLVFRAE